MSHVCVAMSGGVDSAGAALLLRQTGHDVFGVTLRLHHYKERPGLCGSADDIETAKAVAASLGIPHTVLDLCHLFQREVMDKIISKCKTLSVSELNELAETVLPWLTTDLSASNALSLAFSAISNGYYNYDLQSLRLPADNTWYDAMISGMSVLSIDFDENRDLFFETVYGKSYAELSAE